MIRRHIKHRLSKGCLVQEMRRQIQKAKYKVIWKVGNCSGRLGRDCQTDKVSNFRSKHNAVLSLICIHLYEFIKDGQERSLSVCLVQSKCQTFILALSFLKLKLYSAHLVHLLFCSQKCSSLPNVVN